MRLNQFAQNQARKVFVVDDGCGDFLFVLLTQFWPPAASAGNDSSTRKFPFSELTRMLASLPYRASSLLRTFFNPRPLFRIELESGSKVFSMARRTRPLWLWPERRTVPPSGRLAMPCVIAFSTSGCRRSGGRSIELESS